LAFLRASQLLSTWHLTDSTTDCLRYASCVRLVSKQRNLVSAAEEQTYHPFCDTVDGFKFCSHLAGTMRQVSCVRQWA